MDMFESLKAKIQGKNVRIVFPEGAEERIQGAVVRLKEDGLVEPVLLGNPDDLQAKAKESGLDLSGIEIIDPNNYDAFDEMVEAFVERRRGKATEEQAREILKDENYFGTMLVYQDKVDGLVSGAVHSTGDTVRPALQIVKTKEGVRSTSGAFIMVRDDERYVFADCAINIDPDKEALAEIAIESAKTAELFDIEPNVAMLSFSTKGSASAPQQEKVAEAVAIAQEKAPERFNIDGELQFDAAFVESVGKQKAPDSKVAGQAKVFVFPEIQSGNIGYKIAQRLGGFEAIGPILQGMAKPISDLSRGCNEEDVYKISIITANQALLDD
ncbi:MULTISPECIES: phosphate acetyltransferase [Aerococcus]|uniref:Phosphate acetyltransferase n=1 Tax=Aerococcus sanguinicola TaxID=119206 RepID=A0A5N1GPX8_9LACT|nr:MULTISPECIES: phosphate acetyltransferase [Aerococcus]KAA9302101.1 phosphate acetyltransferase [Aerococcus sanguinicola]MDK6368470.1 phosphate acetyltransferase [Aerococcus sp. UMB9870]MDK6679553.1 phosphate acetyltransferase [Aerococcus sp. UMB8608]MDK6686397.1 phosphate acetyltransferase [Aerococcus sp. UMB8623]MDK6940981.1 phosphate acetyltransferase [Aerococcus sp. UMB8487]